MMFGNQCIKNRWNFFMILRSHYKRFVTLEKPKPEPNHIHILSGSDFQKGGSCFFGMVWSGRIESPLDSTPTLYSTLLYVTIFKVKIISFNFNWIILKATIRSLVKFILVFIRLLVTAVTLELFFYTDACLLLILLQFLWFDVGWNIKLGKQEKQCHNVTEVCAHDSPRHLTVIVC